MKKLLSTIILAGATVTVFAQAINMDDVTTGYVQNFDGLANTGTAPVLAGNIYNQAGATLPGWVYGNSTNAGASLANIAAMGIDNGASNSGGIKSYGTTAATDRALGFLGSGTPQNISSGVRLINNTGAGITHITIDFDMEQWRLGGGTTVGANELYFSYKLFDSGSYSQADFDSTILNVVAPLEPTQLGLGYSQANAFFQVSADNGATYTGPTALAPAVGINSPIGNVGTAAALDGNLQVNKVRVAVNILLGAGQDINGRAITWDPGEEIVLRFADINDSGIDNGLGIDNLQVTPEPATILAMIFGAGGMVATRRRRNSL